MIDVDDDDELGFLPGLLAKHAFDPRILLESIKYSSTGASTRKMSPEVITSLSNSNDEGSSGLEDTLSEDPSEGSSEASSPEVARPEKRRKLCCRALAEHYAIDLMTCMTTVVDLVEFRTIYDIPDGILLKVPGKKDTPS